MYKTKLLQAYYMTRKINKATCILSIMLLFFSCSFLTTNSGIPERPKDEVSQRQDSAMVELLDNPIPKESPIWMHENFATAAYMLNREMRKADQGILTIRNEFFTDEMARDVEAGFHWHAYILERLYWMFSSESKYFPGRMSIEAESAILNMLWEWSSSHCIADFAKPDRALWVWGSENHQLQAWVSYWGAAHIFKKHPKYKKHTYSDGSTPEQMAKAFDEYFKAYIRGRATRGLMVEIASPTYAKYSLNTIYNLADFAEDVVLKKMAGDYLNLYWTEWAIEQIDGIRGGSRHRCYPGSKSIIQSGADEFAWYHFGIGRTERSKAPGNMCMLTTYWRPNEIVINLVHNHHYAGDYAYISRCYGLKSDEEPTSYFGQKSPIYKFDTENGGYLRYSWITPVYIMGITMQDAFSPEKWNNVSSQNRWHGLIFAGNYTARIFTQPDKPERGSVYDAEWGVQNRGVMILQRLPKSNASGQALWIDKTLSMIERDGWIFIEAPEAYTAIKIIHGDIRKLCAQDYGAGIANAGFWLKLDDEFSPIIMEAAEKKQFTSFIEFQDLIIANPLTVEINKIKYESKHHKTSLTLFSDYSALPLIDNNPINLKPLHLFESPFLRSVWGSGIVTINDGTKNREFNFNY